MSAKKPGVIGIAVAVTLILAGCGSTVGQVEQAPATVKPVAGSRVQQVQLTGPAVHRLGVRTQPVAVATGAASSPGGPHKVIPYSAVVYDTDGSTWTYVNTAARNFVRERIAVAEIEGPTAVLTKGPAVGAMVVTVGAPELLGAEYDISGEE